MSQIEEALGPLLKPYDSGVLSDMHSRHRNFSKHAGEAFCAGFPDICLECGICLDLLGFSCAPAEFILQNVSDGKGILVAGELQKSIQNRIRDKSEKVRYQDRIREYANWWLILVDHVCHVPIDILAEHELSFVREQNYDFWSRVVIVSSRNMDWDYELFTTGTDHGVSSPQR